MRKRMLAMTGVVLGLLFAVAAPASAHSSLVSGQTSCVNVNHVVTWSIGNDFGLPMTIDTATATLGNQTFPVTGYVNPVSQGTPTTATTTIPGNLTGVVTLTVHSVWSDDFTQTNTATVDLTVPCNSDTTTVPETTTVPGATTTTVTVPETTTSLDVLPTTTVVPPPLATTTTGPQTTTTYICTVPPITSINVPPCTVLPHTGSSSGPMIVGGLFLLGIGGVLAGTARKRNWI